MEQEVPLENSDAPIRGRTGGPDSSTGMITPDSLPWALTLKRTPETRSGSSAAPRTSTGPLGPERLEPGVLNSSSFPFSRLRSGIISESAHPLMTTVCVRNRTRRASVRRPRRPHPPCSDSPPERFSRFAAWTGSSGWMWSGVAAGRPSRVFGQIMSGSLIRWILPEGPLGRDSRTWMRSGARKSPILERQCSMSCSMVTVEACFKRTAASTRWP